MLIRRLALFVLLCASISCRSVGTHQEADERLDELFRRLRQADAISVSFRSQILLAGKEEASYSGSCTVLPDRSAKVVIDGSERRHEGREQFQWALRVSGNSGHIDADHRGQSISKEIQVVYSAGDSVRFLPVLTGLGLWRMWFATLSVDNQDEIERLGGYAYADSVEVLGNDILEGRSAVVLKYRVSTFFGVGTERFQVSLWIDPKTDLPIKHTAQYWNSQEDEEGTWVTVYESFEVK